MNNNKDCRVGQLTNPHYKIFYTTVTPHNKVLYSKVTPTTKSSTQQPAPKAPQCALTTAPISGHCSPVISWSASSLPFVLLPFCLCAFLPLCLFALLPLIIERKCKPCCPWICKRGWSDCQLSPRWWTSVSNRRPANSYPTSVKLLSHLSESNSPYSSHLISR